LTCFVALTTLSHYRASVWFTSNTISHNSWTWWTNDQPTT